jgi:hypothetical protein
MRIKGNEGGRRWEGGKRLEATAYTYRPYVVSRRNWNRSRLNKNLKSMLEAKAAREGVARYI